MGWNSIIGQENVKIELQRMIINKRIPNALCFWGKVGVGKFATALQIVKTYSCLNPKQQDNLIDSCDNCNNCLNIKKGNYSNLEFIFSLPSGKTSQNETGTIASLNDDQITNIVESLTLKINNPYHRFQIQGASQIRINQIRELRQKLALSNSLPGRKFVIVLEANEMRPEAQNAFLKTLEEPNENITFILICSNKDALLPTILSRCQLIYFPPLPTNLIADEIQKKFNFILSEAQLIAKFSDGSFTQALEFASEEIKLIRNKMVDFLRQSLKKEFPSILLTKEISAFVDKIDKKQALLAIELLLSWFRDCFIISKSGDRSLVRNFDDLPSIERFVRKFGSDSIFQIFDKITIAEKYIHSNVQIGFVFLELFLSLRKTIFETKSKTN